MMCKLKIYTEAEHASRLIEILESCGRIYNYCPAQSASLVYDDVNCKPIEKLWDNNVNIQGIEFDDRYQRACHICLGFIGLKYRYSAKCPCLQLSQDEARKASWCALEEKGYI